jgi:sulfate transport system substrate-binding protein
MKTVKLLNLALFFAITLLSGAVRADSNRVELLNVSYDPTRELYDEYNKYFSGYWKDKTGQRLKVKQSHGGSGKQARSVIDGLEADVVTLALAYDIDAIAKNADLLPTNWQDKFPHRSSPYTSTVVFLVKKGNPKGVKDWDDLAKDGVQVITPNPKTSGGARWNYLAAWAYADKKYNGDEKQIKEFLRKLFANVAIFDTGARGSTVTFVQRGIGDVLIAWENEAFLTLQEFGADKFEIISPSVSILAEPPVAIVTKVAERHGTTEIAKAYLEQLYSKPAQEIIAKNFYRPSDPEVAKKYEGKFPKINMLTIQDFGGWTEAQKKHFDDGGIFDEITKNNR